MTFAVAADAYDRHVGRYGSELGEALADAAGVRAGQRVLDVGSGPGALTRVLAERVGAENVAAVDPSEPFVAAVGERLPGVDVRRASAEKLPFAADQFDAVLAQLVVNFMADPEVGVREMRRVARPGGAVAACVWDYPGEMTLLRVFWDAAAAVAPELAAGPDERTSMRFGEAGELAELWRACGLVDVEAGELVVSAAYESFADLWEPYSMGVGPAGAHVVSLDDEQREVLRAEYERRLGSPRGPFHLSARAWYAVGRA
ncbi:MAG TPA: methyltransferase domain-containing protein [Gaiellaceae bacterium]|nr:methyltransferase domain-containing protein [Gaiellaceae bacterium]